MASTTTKKPTVLVLGGCGTIGRNFVEHLVKNKLASEIRVADKRMSMMAYFSPEHEKIFDDTDYVTELQVDLALDSHVAKAFARESGTWDYVFNFAAETSFGNEDGVYVEKTVNSAVKCANKAVEMGVKLYLYCSTANVYKSQTKAPASETSKTDPWTTPAKFQLQAETELRKIKGLPLVVVRPALVYGPADYANVIVFGVIAGVYKSTEEKMVLLWDKKLHRNTVHVEDVCRACWHLREGHTGKTYNLVDSGDSTQGTLCDIFGAIFKVKTGFHGKLASSMARLALDTTARVANENHLKPWLDMLAEAGIHNSPLTPFMHKELLTNSHLYVDGTAITNKAFKYNYPELSKTEMTKIVKSLVEQKLFPTTEHCLPEWKPKSADDATAGGAGGGAGAS